MKKDINLKDLMSGYRAALRLPVRQAWEKPDSYKKVEGRVIEELEIVQSRCRERTVSCASTLARHLIELEDRLKIDKAALKGTEVAINSHPTDFSSRYYKHGAIPMSTWFFLRHDGKSWWLTNIARAECRNYGYDLKLSEAAKEALLERYRRF